jgi:hypothetical protein
MQKKRSRTEKSENPESKPTPQEALNTAIEARLHEKAPLEVCKAVFLSKRETWATVLTRHLAVLGIFDVAAAREMRELTEGPIVKKDMEYPIGGTAGGWKEILIAKLTPRG